MEMRIVNSTLGAWRKENVENLAEKFGAIKTEKEPA